MGKNPLLMVAERLQDFRQFGGDAHEAEGCLVSAEIEWEGESLVLP